MPINQSIFIYLAVFILFMPKFSFLQEILPNPTYETNLFNSLLAKYDKNTRPQSFLDVYTRVELFQIVNIDERNQLMTSSFYLIQEWYDIRLRWNPAVSGNMTYFQIPIKSVWHPDTYIVNSADTDAFIKVTDTSMVSIHHTGFLNFINPSFSVKTRCQMNVKKFPFDTQHCPITVGSWSKQMNVLAYSPVFHDVGVVMYSPSSLWDLIGTKSEQFQQPSKLIFNQIAHTNVKYTLVLRRRPLYIMVNAIFPSFVLNIITIIAYLLPYSAQISLSKLISSLNCIFIY